MLPKSGVPKDDIPLAKTCDCKECPFSMSLVLQDEVDHLCHLACFVGCPVDVQYGDGARKSSGVNSVLDPKFMVDE